VEASKAKLVRWLSLMREIYNLYWSLSQRIANWRARYLHWYMLNYAKKVPTFANSYIHSSTKNIRRFQVALLNENEEVALFS